MGNPWEEINLSDYENHMSLDSVYQLQALNAMMREQFAVYPVASIMILGIAGGNGLEHIPTEQVKLVYGVDVNSDFLAQCEARYPALTGILKTLRIDLLDEALQLPPAELLVANLLIEYIGYEAFQRVVRLVKPQYVSCIIQINTGDSFVSDSPYLHAFDGLDAVHHQMEEQRLTVAMREIDYSVQKAEERLLPNGKKFVRLDFARM
ncbi:MAG: class I SAM-dependent methyltransferase [Lachnospiraceae bacterium]|nr:class I SAM-dependent methyltransferase [Lachnospiraceae bacterium]